MVREAMDFVTAFDPELGRMIEAEYKRQARNIELIASENIVSEAVMAAMGSVLTNKYAEGYPGKRYSGGERAAALGRAGEHGGLSGAVQAG